MSSTAQGSAEWRKELPGSGDAGGGGKSKQKNRPKKQQGHAQSADLYPSQTQSAAPASLRAQLSTQIDVLCTIRDRLTPACTSQADQILLGEMEFNLNRSSAYCRELHMAALKHEMRSSRGASVDPKQLESAKKDAANANAQVKELKATVTSLEARLKDAEELREESETLSSGLNMMFTRIKTLEGKLSPQEEPRRPPQVATPAGGAVAPGDGNTPESRPAMVEEGDAGGVDGEQPPPSPAPASKLPPVVEATVEVRRPATHPDTIEMGECQVDISHLRVKYAEKRFFPGHVPPRYLSFYDRVLLLDDVSDEAGVDVSDDSHTARTARAAVFCRRNADGLSVVRVERAAVAQGLQVAYLDLVAAARAIATNFAPSEQGLSQDGQIAATYLLCAGLIA